MSPEFAVLESFGNSGFAFSYREPPEEFALEARSEGLVIPLWPSSESLSSELGHTSTVAAPEVVAVSLAWLWQLQESAPPSPPLLIEFNCEGQAKVYTIPEFRRLTRELAVQQGVPRDAPASAASPLRPGRA